MSYSTEADKPNWRNRIIGVVVLGGIALFAAFQTGLL